MLAGDIDLHAGDGFVEQPAPGGAAADVALVDETLQLVGELVRAPHAQIAQKGAPAGELRVGELGLEHFVVELVQLQAKKQDVGADVGAALHHALVEAAGLGVRAVGAEQELGVGHDAAEALVDRLVGRHGGGQGGA